MGTTIMNFLLVNKHTYPNLHDHMVGLDTRKKIELHAAIKLRRWLHEQHGEAWEGHYYFTEHPDVVYHDTLTNQCYGIEITEVFPSLATKDVHQIMQNNGSKRTWANDVAGVIKLHMPEVPVAVDVAFNQEPTGDIRSFLNGIDKEHLLGAVRYLAEQEQSFGSLYTSELMLLGLPQISNLRVMRSETTGVDFTLSGMSNTFDIDDVVTRYSKKNTIYENGINLESYPAPYAGTCLLMVSYMRDNGSFVDPPEQEQLSVLNAEPRSSFDRVYYTNNSGNYYQFELAR